MAALDISLTEDELNEYLRTQRTVRLATASLDGRPQVVPLWFVWIGGGLFLNTTLGNLTVRNLQGNPRATGSIDDGETYDTLRGVLLEGAVAFAADDPGVPQARRAWSEKYMGGNPVPYDRWKNRVWLRLHPERISSWDFRKIPEAKARAQAKERAAGGDG
jgi:nitroimidazol reductase NimA-like FMN-containing flavoprotein (pyridoxamine 5'-phosphate oxidase superfamily)